MALPTRYDFKSSEPRLYQEWTENNLFATRLDGDGRPFCIAIPPPNVTGSLHAGHSLNYTLQDIIVRYQRMTGRPVLFQPGTDHAGIATQFVVERELAKEGLTRFQLGRDKFIERVWEWKDVHEKKIVDQLKKLGVSCDWSRLRFTMDPQYSRAVLTAFKRLYAKGYIYKGKYLVNWCPRCRTALSDLEVVHRNEQRKLYYIRYRIKDEALRYLEVATTRPETMLGDTACAVNPGDKRYSHLIGKAVVVPLVNREVPIIADDFVLPEFGTGIVKITPAHDFNDNECAKRHGLPAIAIFDEEARINENGGAYKGMDRFEARGKIIADLENRGLLARQEDYEISLGRCSRCDQILEPYLSDQWFVRMKELAALCLNEIKEKRVRFVPAGWEDVAVKWLEGIHDWCISRQLWWGHRIPVFTCAKCGASACHVEGSEYACPSCSIPMKQSEDVLDTWFSSALWPFATLGWPDETPELSRFYPGSLLVTDRGIINLWVSRMVYMGVELTGKRPFDEVYINATVLTLEGQRHSKSKGVGFDFTEIINEYGADPLRFILCRKSTGLQDMRLDKPPKDNSIVEARNFVTKLYNASRYVLGKIEGKDKLDIALSKDDLTQIEDRWIVSALNRLKERSSALLSGYEFSEYAKSIYCFVWDCFCDYYLELSKKSANPACPKILASALTDILKLAAPVIPFVAEEIWKELRNHVSLGTPYLASARWPKVETGLIDRDAEKRFEVILCCARAVRSVRNRFNIPFKEPLEVLITRDAGVKEAGRILGTLANVSALTVTDGGRIRDSACEVIGDFKLYIPLKGKIDLAIERKRLAEKEAELSVRIAGLRARLDDASFTRRAPPEVVDETRQALAALEAQLAEVRNTAACLG